MTFFLINPFVADFTFSLLLSEHSFFLTMAIITFALSVVLKSKKAVFYQFVVLISIFTIEESMQNVLYILLLAVQIFLSALVIYRLKKAVHRNYLLVLEKTHKIPRTITKGGSLGSQTSFFEKK